MATTTSSGSEAKERAARLLHKKQSGPGRPESVVSSSQKSSQKSSQSTERRASRQYGGYRRGSIGTSYPPSQLGLQSRKLIRYENSYQLGPSTTFPHAQASKIVKEVVESYLQNETYNPELCRQMSKTLSEVVRSRIKELMVPRYKVVSIVHLGELAGQDMRVASRCLWDENVDQCVSYQFTNNSLYAVVMVYVVYHD